MAALTITAANVSLVSGPTEVIDAGEAFNAGEVLYKSTAGTWLKAQGDDDAENAGSGGLALALGTADAANARVVAALPGAIVALGTGTAGVIYVPGDTAGSLVPVADAGTGDKVVPFACGIGSNRVQLIDGYAAGCELA